MTECYTLARGSTVRVTELDRRGGYDPAAVRHVVSRAVARIAVQEIVDNGADERIRNDEDKRRLRLVRSDRPIRYSVDIDFVRTDPELLAMIAGVRLVTGGESIVGFDALTNARATSFALEVWTNLAGQCSGWGYTLLPFLKGGRLSGFKFADGLVSFNLRGALTQRTPKWGIGPYMMDGWCKLEQPVSRNTHYRQIIVSKGPPAETHGAALYEDEIDGGTAMMTTPDELDGGTPFEAGPCVVDGGAA